MKIFYLQGDYPFCYYYRGYLPGVYSDQTVVSDFLRKDMDVSNEQFTKKAMAADVICFQRPSSEPSLKLAQLLRQAGKKIIFDNDDSYAGVPLDKLENDRQREIAKQLNNNLNDFVKMADGVTVSTEFLAKEYRQYNDNVVVLKNTVDPLDEYPCEPNTTGKFRVGIIGSVSSNDDYIHIKDQIKRLDARGDIQFVLMGVQYQDGEVMPSMQNDFDFWDSLENMEWHTVVPVTDYMANVASFALDLVIAPRKEHYFNQCKSNLKALEMSLLGIPFIAQGFSDGTSPYQGDIEPYITVVNDNNDWYNEVIKCKDSHEEYKKLAAKAHDFVLKEYNITNYAQVWQQKIENLCKYQKNI